jgi:hypothetical protein
VGLVDAAVEAGANEVGRLEFTVENLEQLCAKDRAKAAAVARRKAEQLATSLSGKLGHLVGAGESYPGASRSYWGDCPYHGCYAGDGAGGMARANASIANDGAARHRRRLSMPPAKS